MAQYTNFNTSMNRSESDGRFYDNFQLGFRHKFHNKHSINLRARYLQRELNQGEQEAENSIMVEYSIPLELPVRRRRNVGNLMGYVHRLDEPVKNAILSLNGVLAVTDENGYFFYPTVSANDYDLTVDTSRSDLFDYTTDKKQPYQIVITPMTDNKVNIGLIRGATITGRVMIYRSKGGSLLANSVLGTNQSKKKVTLVKDKPLGGVLVTLQRLEKNADDTVIHKRLSWNDGRFDFRGIRPGRWLLTFKSSSLPEYHAFEKARRTITLKAGAKQDLLIKVVPKQRKIKMIGPAEGLSVVGE